MKYIWNNFGFSIAFTVAALLIAGWLGYSGGGLLAGALSMIFIAGVLGVMETSLSLDNAVVNASVLKDMDPVWQRRFSDLGHPDRGVRDAYRVPDPDRRLRRVGIAVGSDQHRGVGPRIVRAHP